MVSLGRACVITIQCKGAGECTEGVCNCPAGTIRKGDHCEKKPRSVKPVLLSASFRPTIDGSTNPNEPNLSTTLDSSLCPSPRLPYRANDIPMQCTSGKVCPKGFTCTYSRSVQNYFCCSNINQSKDDKSKNVCTIGSPLLYPATGQAIQCSRSRRCPPGYTCKRNSTSEVLYCCTGETLVRQTNRAGRVFLLASQRGHPSDQ
ncbi:hypothetical protein COOONC_05550, partial [Cooperia oncophora]